jgi:nucleoid-associated protein YgaU
MVTTTAASPGAELAALAELALAQAAGSARAGSLAEAESWARAAIELRADASGHGLLGRILAQQGQHEAALAALRRAVELDPAAADLREALARLERGPLQPGRRLLVTGAAVAVPLAAIAWPWPRTRPAVALAGTAATAASAAAAGVPGGAASAAPGATLAQVQAYAALNMALMRFDTLAQLKSRAALGTEGLRVSLEGSAPTAFVRDAIAAEAAKVQGIGIDASAITLQPGYRVRRGDTLWSLAERLYGDAAQWRRLRDANRARVGADARIEVGTLLETP